MGANTCARCGEAIRNAAYGSRCEDCWVDTSLFARSPPNPDRTSNSTGQQYGAVLNGGRIRVYRVPKDLRARVR